MSSFKECKKVADKIGRAVQIQQRFIGTVWLDPLGRPKDVDEEDMEWVEEGLFGLGALFSFDTQGRTVVHQVDFCFVLFFFWGFCCGEARTRVLG